MIKLQVVFSAELTEEVVSVVPFRDKIIIATRNRLLLAEHDEELDVKVIQLAHLHGGDLL